VPIYEYTCKSCLQPVEILHRSFREKDPVCPLCGSHQLEKRWSVPGLLNSSPGKDNDRPSCCQAEAGNCSRCSDYEGCDCQGVDN